MLAEQIVEYDIGELALEMHDFTLPVVGVIDDLPGALEFSVRESPVFYLAQPFVRVLGGSLFETSLWSCLLLTTELFLQSDRYICRSRWWDLESWSRHLGRGGRKMSEAV